MIIKSISSEPLSLPFSSKDTGHDGFVFKKPFDFNTILESVQVNPYHQRAISCKILMTVGLGYNLLVNDKTSEDKTKFESLWPNGFQDEIVKIATDLETFGNAYIEVVKGNKGYAAAMYHVPAITMWITKEGFRQEIDGSSRVDFFPFETTSSDRGIAHIKLYSQSASRYGLPDWIGCLNSIILDAHATEWNYKFFENNCMPAWAIVIKDSNLTEQAETAIKDFFSQKYKGVANTHKTLVMAQSNIEVQFQKLQADAKDMSFERLKEICRDEIVAAHGVPPRLLGIVAAGQLGGGGEMQWQLKQFKEGICKARQRLYEDAINKLLGREMTIKFNEMDVTDLKDDAEYYSKLVERYILMPNEARQQLGYEELKELDSMMLARVFQ